MPRPSTAGALLTDYPELTGRAISTRPTFQLGPDPAEQGWPTIAPGDHEAFMRYAHDLARKSPPKPTNLCVSALLVDTKTGQILSTGYTPELDENTHKEQCAIDKFLKFHKVEDTHVTSYGMSWAVRNFIADMEGQGMKSGIDIYTIMEPCSRKNSGLQSCVDRILGIRSLINKIYVGVKEPGIFVGENRGDDTLKGRGVDVVHVEGMEEEILGVANAGHAGEDDREFMHKRLEGENEHLAMINRELEEEIEELREREEEIFDEWGEHWRKSLVERLKDNEEELDEDEKIWDYVRFVEEPAKEKEAPRAGVKRLKEENKKLREMVRKSAECKEGDVLGRAREENGRLRVVNEELGREYERLKESVWKFEERWMWRREDRIRKRGDAAAVNTVFCVVSRVSNFSLSL